MRSSVLESKELETADDFPQSATRLDVGTGEPMALPLGVRPRIVSAVTARIWACLTA